MDFWRFMDGTYQPANALDGQYNLVLVLLSYFIAALAALAALQIASQARSGMDGSRRTGWLGFGALFMGVGIWAMHFIGMLAFSLPVAATYDPVLTIISVFPGIIGSAAALYVLSDTRASHRAVAVGALLLAAGIGTLHYTGMEAMEMEAVMRYDFTLFVGSVVVAFILALIALYARFVVEPQSSGTAIKLVSAAVMGAAVAGMHYIAMGASYFFLPQGREVAAAGAEAAVAPFDPNILAGGIGLAAFVVLVIPILGAMMEAE